MRVTAAGRGKARGGPRVLTDRNTPQASPRLFLVLVPPLPRPSSCKKAPPLSLVRARGPALPADPERGSGGPEAVGCPQAPPHPLAPPPARPPAPPPRGPTLRGAGLAPAGVGGGGCGNFPGGSNGCARAAVRRGGERARGRGAAKSQRPRGWSPGQARSDPRSPRCAPLLSPGAADAPRPRETPARPAPQEAAAATQSSARSARAPWRGRRPPPAPRSCWSRPTWARSSTT